MSCDDPTHTLTDEDAAYYRRVLHGLIDRTEAVTITLHRQITAPDDAAPDATAPQVKTPDLTARFDRAAHSLRQAIGLAWAVAERRFPFAAPAPRRPAEHPPEHRELARKQILRTVENAILDKAHPLDVEPLRLELFDRLDAPDLDREIARRPIQDLVRDLVGDLGLERAYPRGLVVRRTPQDAAALAARASARSEPGAARAAAPIDSGDAIDPDGPDDPAKREDPPPKPG